MHLRGSSWALVALWIVGLATNTALGASMNDDLFEQLEEGDQVCVYDGNLYPSGSFNLTDCVSCTCSGETGELRCRAAVCPAKTPACVRYEKLPGRCCEECVAYGCFVNDTGYPLGSRIPLGPCKKCYCPWEVRARRPGEPVCFTITCRESTCEKPEVRPDRCCPICPAVKSTVRPKPAYHHPSRSRTSSQADEPFSTYIEMWAAAKRLNT